MRIKHLLNFFVATVFIGVAVGCAEKDLYDPNYGKEPVKGPEEYFGFETRGDVSLDVNYALPGFAALIEVYDIDPMEIVDNTPVKKQGVEALFKIYTDESGKFNGKMNIPTSVKSIYLYTESWGLPRCMPLEIKDGMVSFDMSNIGASTVKAKNNTRSYGFQGTVPYVLNGNNKLYSLCKWGEGGSLDSKYMSFEENVGDETVGSLTQRLKNFFNPDGIANVDNMNLVTQSRTTNITVTQDGTALDVIFLNRDAMYNNSFGYYYYKTSKEPDMCGMSDMKKYIIFPNVSFSVYGGQLPILKCGSKVRLLYFDEQGNAKEEFPAGYTVGWFMYADGYNQSENEIDITKQVASGFSNLLASNQVLGQQRQNFVSVKDETSGKVIIGVEDGANNSYCDLLFYVNASKTIEEPNDRPVITPDDGNEPEKPDVTETKTGTLAFEDIWPGGGDYDMNDIVLTIQKRKIYTNKENKVTKFELSIDLSAAGATKSIGAAIMLDNVPANAITQPVEFSDNTLAKNFNLNNNNIESGQDYAVIPLFDDAHKVLGRDRYEQINTVSDYAGNTKPKNISFSITFNNPTISADAFNVNKLNVFIIVDGNRNPRKEIHVAGYQPTKLANTDLFGGNNDNSHHASKKYYISKETGSYYIENLTVSIAKQAWELFLAVEEEGGFYAAVKAGKVQAAVNESNKTRHKAVAQRREVLLGTNQFPNFNEKAGEKKPLEATCCCGGHDTCEKDVQTLNFDRAASEFEALRLETEASGKRPKAFMLTIGNLAMRQARAQFSCNFLACAGYEVVDNLGFPTVEAGIEAAMAAKADIVVLCSSDDEYAEYAVPAFKALDGRAIFIVAGAPANMEELKAVGIENFIHVRVNVLETLKEFNAKLLK